MGKILIIASTIIIVLSLLGLRRKNNKKIIRDIKNTIIEINQTYKDIFTEKDIMSRSIHGLIFIVSELLIVFTVVKLGVRRIIEDASTTNVLWSVLVILLVLLAIHLAMGYLLMITSGIQKFIYKVENRTLKNNLLISYFILSTYFTVYLLEPSQFEGIEILALVGLGISYILNLKVLIKLIKNPEHINAKNNEKTVNLKYKANNRMTVVAILLLFMIVLNLFLAIGIINEAYPGAFSNNPSRFDLFYYTIITFTTIGYGDIVPIALPAKIISMIIAITSVICLTIFLSTVMSYNSEEKES